MSTTIQMTLPYYINSFPHILCLFIFIHIYAGGCTNVVHPIFFIDLHLFYTEKKVYIFS